jgi:hypothetical protein
VNFFEASAPGCRLVWLPGVGQEQDKRSLFNDPEDGKLDASEWLLERKGFLPVPILITEPAVGYGAGAALLFFRESIGDAVTKAKESGRLTPPDIYGAALAATENGTKVAAPSAWSPSPSSSGAGAAASRARTSTSTSTARTAPTARAT